MGVIGLRAIGDRHHKETHRAVLAAVAQIGVGVLSLASVWSKQGWVEGLESVSTRGRPLEKRVGWVA